MQNYFIAVFDRESDSGLLSKLPDVEVGGGFNVSADFLNGWVHNIMDDGVRSEDVSVVSGDSQGSVIGL